MDDKGFAFSVLLIILAGFFQGTFGLGMKKFAPLAWEAFWIIFSVVGMVCIPYIWSAATIPSMWSAISSVSGGTLIKSIFFGACWGVGGIMFGLAIRYVGMSIAYGISMGLAAAMGSLIPLFRIPNIGSNPAVPYIIVGVFVMVIGVAVLTMAGVQREKTQNAEGKEIVGITRGKLFKVGLIFAILNGIFAALLNVGFTLASPAADAAISQGALPRNASLVQWVIVLFGGFIINLLYTLYLLIKNRSYQTYFSNGAYKGYFWSILTAVLWFAALGVYGQGSAIMGKLGPVIGWTMFLALSLVISNLWGIGAGEWKDMHKPFKVLMLGNAVLIVSWIILGYSQYIMTKAA